MLTEDDVRRIIREELDRVRVLPVHTTPQPPSIWPEWANRCPNGCAPGTVCMSAHCPQRPVIS